MRCACPPRPAQRSMSFSVVVPAPCCNGYRTSDQSHVVSLEGRTWAREGHTWARDGSHGSSFWFQRIPEFSKDVNTCARSNHTCPYTRPKHIHTGMHPHSASTSPPNASTDASPEAEVPFVLCPIVALPMAPVLAGLTTTVLLLATRVASGGRVFIMLVRLAR